MLNIFPDIPTLSDTIKTLLPLSDFGFKENVKTDSAIIYNSQWCRVKFYINVDWHNKDLRICYGRLHASDNEWIMKWNEEDCYCWHDYPTLHLSLKYLSGISPEDAYQEHLTHKRLPLFQEFFDSYPPVKNQQDVVERQIKFEAAVWENYGISFFELFDLRRPDLWKGFTNFLKRYYGLIDEEMDAGFRKKGLTRTPVSIPGYKIC